MNKIEVKSAVFCFKKEITMKYIFCQFLVYFRKDNSFNMFFSFFRSRQLSSISSPAESVVYTHTHTYIYIYMYIYVYIYMCVCKLNRDMRRASI